MLDKVIKTGIINLKNAIYTLVNGSFPDTMSRILAVIPPGSLNIRPKGEKGSKFGRLGKPLDCSIS